MGNTINIKEFNHDYDCPFSFEGSKFKCKILDIISYNKFKVVFIYNKKPYTWKVKLSGINIDSSYSESSGLSYVSGLIYKNNNKARIICGELEDGFINVFMYLKSENKTLNELLLDYGYNNTINYETSNSLNIIDFNNIYQDEVDEVNEDKKKPLENSLNIYNKINHDLKHESNNESYQDKVENFKTTNIIYVKPIEEVQQSNLNLIDLEDKNKKNAFYEELNQAVSVKTFLKEI